MKFGGTSVDGAARLAAAARVVASRRTERPVVVTSAMAGVTNALEALLSLARRADRAGVDARLEEVRARHLAVAAELAPGDAALAARLEDRLRDLRVLLRGVRLVGALTPAASDAVLGDVELLAQVLFAAAMAAADGPAEVVDSRRVVATDGRHGAAVAD
ncbi:MAG: lysine-sensitive aspartokinase 3, partial [Candidatus Polarisedimenticolia bacterium]